jgi:hypothetical protein
VLRAASAPTVFGIFYPDAATSIQRIKFGRMSFPIVENEG